MTINNETLEFKTNVAPDVVENLTNDQNNKLCAAYLLIGSPSLESIAAFHGWLIHKGYATQAFFALERQRRTVGETPRESGMFAKL